MIVHKYRSRSYCIKNKHKNMHVVILLQSNFRFAYLTSYNKNNVFNFRLF